MSNLKIDYDFYKEENILADEIWTSIKLYKNTKLLIDFATCYQISNYGRARSLDRTVLCKDGRKIFYKGQLLKPKFRLSKTTRKIEHNYIAFNLHCKKNYNLAAHKIVKESFDGCTPEDYEISHDDHNYLNNKLDNLIFRTHTENMHHDNIAAKMPNRKNLWSQLTIDDVVLMRQLYNSGKLTNCTKLAEKFNCGRKHAWNIVNNKKRKNG